MGKSFALAGLVLATVFSGYMVGWIHAHETVSTECQRLGGFYVGKSTFTCSKAQPAQAGADRG